MANRFKTVLRKSRFVVRGYSPNAMAEVGQATRNDIEQRILRAEDVYDAPVAPLAPGYAKRKARKSPPAIRNWKYTGRTLRSMKVLSAETNKATIGFTDAVSNTRAAINNRKARQFGVSPLNRVRALIPALRKARPIQVEKS